MSYKKSYEEELSSLSTRIMMKAHSDQLDKGGEPYIFHPMSVAQRLEIFNDDINITITALLHDVVEDSDYTFEQLLEEGIPETVIESLKLLTKPKQMPYEQYINRLLESKDIRAIIVKKADLEDNMDITRLKELTDKDLKRLQKYHKAYKRIFSYLESEFSWRLLEK